MSIIPCGPNADDKYCEQFWDQHAQIKALGAKHEELKQRIREATKKFVQDLAYTAPEGLIERFSEELPIIIERAFQESRDLTGMILEAVSEEQ